MLNNRNTENDPLDTEDWELALAPYKGNSSAALNLGFILIILKTYIYLEPLQIDKAIEGIDRGLEVLFPHTDFHDKSFELFLKVVEGKLTLEEEEMLKKLGLKF